MPEFSCTTCSLKFPTVTQWRKHQCTSNHGKTNNAEFSCTTCSLKFPTVTQWRKHQCISNHAKTNNAESSSSRVFVNNLSPNTTVNDIKECFSKFGKVLKAVIMQAGNSASVTYSKPEEAMIACQKNAKCRLLGRTLYIKVFKKKSKPASKPAARVVLEKKDELMNCTTVSEQIEQFCSTNSLTQEEVNQREEIRQDIEKLLRLYYPTCSLHIFGSSGHGFGLKHCDLDLLFLPCPDYWEKKDELVERDSGISGLSYDQFIRSCPKDHLMFIKKLFHKERSRFTPPFYIPAKCPIIRMTSRKYNVECDLSCTAGMVLQNTKLLNFYSRLDSRVVPLMMVLRKWAKHYTIIGNSHLSTYAFSLMIVFYLQKTTPPVLPPVTQLKSKATENIVIENWDCSFSTDVSLFPPSCNKDTVETLLMGFLTFYVDFDFDFVISPFLGVHLNRNDFKHFPNVGYQNFETSPMCIQDPLELNRNVAAHRAKAVLALLKDRAVSCLLTMNNHLNKTSDNTKWGIMNLFLTLPKLPSAKIVECISNDHTIAEVASSGKFTMRFTELFKDHMTDPKTTKFKRKITNCLFRIFKDAFEFECEIIDMCHIPPGKQKKQRFYENLEESPVLSKEHGKESSKDTEMELEIKSLLELVTSNESLPQKLPESVPPKLLVAFQNVAYSNVWVGRTDHIKDHRLEGERKKMMAFEQKVTQEMMERVTPAIKPYLMSCYCFVYRKHHVDHLSVVIKPYSAIPDFKILIQCVNSVVVELLNDIR